MLYHGLRFIHLLVESGSQHNIHGSGELHQGLQVVDLLVQPPHHLFEEVVHPRGHSMMGKIEIDNDVANMDAQSAESVIRDISVKELK